MNQQITIQDLTQFGHVVSYRNDERKAYVTKGNTGWVCAMSKHGYRNSVRYATKKAAIQCLLEFINR